MYLKIISAILIVVWLILVLLGKGGFSYMFLLLGSAIGVLQLIADYRLRMTK